MAINNRTFGVQTFNPLFPWLNQSNYNKVVAYGNSLWLDDEEEKRKAENQYYRKNVKKMVNDQILDERDVEINEQSYKAANINTKDADTKLRATELSQALKRKYDLDAKANDEEIVDRYISKLTPEGKNLAGKYLAWESNEFLKLAWLDNVNMPEKKSEDKWRTLWQKAEEFAVWVAQSPWKWGYNLIWQWIDRAWKTLADKLQWSDLQKTIQDLAVDMFGEEEVKKYQEEKAKQLAEWTAFNGREATDIRTPLLWEERANSWWTKGWEVVWDIASWIAVTAPIAAATAPIYASSTLWGAATLWALEWWLDAAITKYWATWEAPTVWDIALWWIMWAWWGLFSKYMQNLPKDKTNSLRKEAEEYINKSIKPTVKGKMSQSDYNKYIDDTLDVVDFMDKNKSVLQYTDDAWEVVNGKLPTNMRETSETLGNLKKTLYDAYNNIAVKAWEKWARVNMNKAFSQLDDLERDVSQNIANPQTKTIIDNFKKALLEYTDDAGTISIEDAQKLTQDFNKQLTAFFKNPNMNDVSKNSIVAQLNKWTKEAINDSIDDVLDESIANWGNMAQYYRNLKWMYGKIKTIEDEVSKRALVEARKNAKWLSQTVLDSLAWWEFTDAILTANVGKLWKSAIMKAIWRYYKYVNDPNVQLNNLFKLVQEVNNPWTTQWVIEKWINRAIESIPNSVKDAWLNIVKKAVTPRTVATTAEVLTND